MRTTLVILQALTFVGLGVLLLVAGDTKLASAQLLLAVVTWLVYA